MRLLRPEQWIKNGFVLGPYVFTASFTSVSASRRAGLAVVAFCLAASAGYVFNDLFDVERDRQHPLKRHTRPLAAGLVSPGQAKLVLVGLCLALAAVLAGMPRLAPVVVTYLAVGTAYTLWWKDVPVVDLFALAASFVLRVYGGAVALAVPLSFWMFVTTLCIALHLAAIKRRQELAATGAGARAVLQHYSTALLDYYAEVAAIGAFVFYALFVHSVRPSLLLTIPFVLFGLWRYRYVVETSGLGESPTEAVLRDVPLATTIVLWLAFCVVGLWPG